MTEEEKTKRDDWLCDHPGRDVSEYELLLAQATEAKARQEACPIGTGDNIVSREVGNFIMWETARLVARMSGGSRRHIYEATRL
jgi:hypothetical protein